MARINPNNLPIGRSLFFWSPSAIKAMAMFPVTDFHLLGSRLVFQVTHLPWIGICIYSDKNLLTVMHMCSTADGHLKNKDLLMGRLLVFILATADAHLHHFLQCGIKREHVYSYLKLFGYPDFFLLKSKT